VLTVTAIAAPRAAMPPTVLCAGEVRRPFRGIGVSALEVEGLGDNGRCQTTGRLGVNSHSHFGSRRATLRISSRPRLCPRTLHYRSPKAGLHRSAYREHPLRVELSRESHHDSAPPDLVPMDSRRAVARTKRLWRPMHQLSTGVVTRARHPGRRRPTAAEATSGRHPPNHLPPTSAA
jgi:hypothetical protein